MKVTSINNIQAEKVFEGVQLRMAISKQDGANKFFMRIFDVAADAKGPASHHHPYEHEMYIISGHGMILGPNGRLPFKEGDVIFIPPNEEHQLIQEGDIRFICLIPADFPII